MAEVNPPFVLQQATTHTALLFRQALGGAFSNGVAKYNGNNDLLVTAGGGMTTSVARGGAYISGTDATDQGMYFVYNDGPETLTHDASTSSPRIDVVVARINDVAHGGSGNTWTLEVVKGTPAASPVEPSLPNSSMRLASVTIPANADTITADDIVDRRVTVSVLSLADGSVSTSKLVDGAITFGKLSPNLFDMAYYPGAPGGLALPAGQFINIATLQITGAGRYFAFGQVAVDAGGDNPDAHLRALLDIDGTANSQAFAVSMPSGTARQTLPLIWAGTLGGGTHDFSIRGFVDRGNGYVALEYTRAVVMRTP